jgi:ketosteroid isomerase-like protein
MNPILVSMLGILLGGAAGAPDAAALERRSEEANQALVRGDAERYFELIQPSKDFTLMTPFGGTPSRTYAPSPERTAELGKFFKNGTLKQELVAMFPSNDLVVLVTIEHVRVEAGGTPMQDWDLRVTQVFRREGDDWRLVHRHADPLGKKRITVPEAAALARGEPTTEAK